MKKALAALVLTLAAALPARAEDTTQKIRINEEDHYIRTNIVHDENGFGVGHVDGTTIILDDTRIPLVKDGHPTYVPTTDTPKDTIPPLFDIKYAREIERNSFSRYLGLLELEGEEGLTITAHIITPHNTLNARVNNKNSTYQVLLGQHDTEQATIRIMAVDWQGNATEKNITYTQKEVFEHKEGIRLSAGEQAWFEIHQQPELLEHTLTVIRTFNTTTRHDISTLVVTQIDENTGRFTPQGPNNGWFVRRNDTYAIVIGLALFKGEHCKERLEELITHECAHNEYAHLTKEEQEEFTVLWRLYNDYSADLATGLLTYAKKVELNHYSIIFNEGTYLPHNTYLGHTQDMPQELFASALNIYKTPKLKEAFDKKVKELPENKQKEAQEIMDFVAAHITHETESE